MESRTHIWKVATDGSAPARQITFGEKGDSQPQFSPDGKFISFVSARGSAEAKAQIYLMPIDGGEAWKLTDAKENVSVVFVGAGRIAHRVCGDRSAQRRRRSQHQEARRRARVRRRLPLRARVGRRREHQAGDAHHRRHAVDGAGRAVVVAGRQAVRVRRRDDADAARQPPRRVSSADVGDRRQVEKISTNWGNDGTPRWSQDGATIAWVGEPNTTAPLPDGTASRRRDAAAPDALRRQGEDDQGHADAGVRQRRRQSRSGPTKASA